MKRIIPVLFFSCVSLMACNNAEKPVMDSSSMTKTDSTSLTKPKFTVAMVDNKKDPSCGMPVTAGIEDTAHYGGKVYGFCSTECKDEFLKNPEAMAKNAELK